MTHRNVHYEAAFEDYLRARGWPYVAVDEAKKAIFGDVAIKCFDFLVYSSTRANLLVDVKGRKFPDTGRGQRGGPKASRAWENWITREDVTGLGEWQKVFGPDFEPVLVFAYWLQGPPQRSPFDDVHLFRKRHYAYVAIPLSIYTTAAKPRSAKWQTLSMPTAKFRKHIRDVAEFL
jgi:hypothetical protein